jgi:hypothetical protein
LGRPQGFLARQFNAASQNRAFVFIRKKLAVLTLALPMLALSSAFASPADVPAAPEAGPLTTHSHNVDDLNRRFGKAGPHNQILFIDRDDIARRMAQMPRGTARETALQKAVEDYVLERTGLRLPESFSDTIAQGIIGGGGQSLSIAFQRAAGAGSLCMVTGQNPDLSAKAYQQGIMGLYEGIHDDFRNRPMLRQLSPEVSEKFTDYHELGHCMDDRYIMTFLKNPDSRNDPETLINMTHQGEAFAEVFATLMLAREGHADVAGIRADQRLISIATNGYLATQLSAGDDFAKYIGFVYALHEVLWDAQREIERLGSAGLTAMSPQDVVRLAQQITERNVMSKPGSDHAVTFLLENKFKLDVWETLRQDFPHIEERYQTALRVRDHIAQAFIRMFGAESFDPARPVYEQLTREITLGMGQKPDPEKRQRDIARVAATLRLDSGRHDDPEMQIILNAARAKEDLRRSLNDLSVPENLRAQAMADLILMADAMREAILALRQERLPLPSMDNHVRLMVPVMPPPGPWPA